MEIDFLIILFLVWRHNIYKIIFQGEKLRREYNIIYIESIASNV